MPTTTERWGDCEPNYRTFEGWPDEDWAAIAAEGYDALSPNARRYVEYVERELGVPAVALGVGPGRDETIVRERPFENSEG
jgi:adenylosuccinate synthase